MEAWRVESAAGRHPDVFSAIARLHVSQIHHGVLPLLGDDALAGLYARVSEAPAAGVWFIQRDETVMGFLAGCANVQLLYRWLATHAGLPILGRVLRSGPSAWWRLRSVAAYPFKKDADPELAAKHVPAELLAIATDPAARRLGVGRALVDHFEEEVRRWNEKAYMVTTNIEETDSNSFYRGLGCEPVGTRRHHALTLQVYRKDLAT